MPFNKAFNLLSVTLCSLYFPTDSGVLTRVRTLKMKGTKLMGGGGAAPPCNNVQAQNNLGRGFPLTFFLKKSRYKIYNH